VARLDTKGAELQEERSAALQHGRNPDVPEKKPPGPFDEALREAASRTPLPRAPEPTVPGDLHQQLEVFRVRLRELWLLPRIQDRMKQIAAETEARERDNVKRFGGVVKRTEAVLMEHWEQSFVDSVNYILKVRPFPGETKRDPYRPKRDHLLAKLQAEETKLVKSAPADLVAQVEALRRSFKEKWQQEVDLAMDRFITLASNEAQFATVRQAAQPVEIYGLPEYLEGTVPASAHPDTVAGEPVAPSVVVFMKAVQRESGLKALASNYPGHERSNPWVGNIEGIGKYSFDVHLDWLIKKNAEGFYEREPIIKFFLAVDRASKATKIAWAAIYNDFEVAKKVNETLGSRRIYFSGGRDGPGGPGSIHHGPEPYLLHIHFNVMPNDLSAQYFAGKNVDMPHLDMGGPR
jgi:hypothetical protein